MNTMKDSDLEKMNRSEQEKEANQAEACVGSGADLTFMI